MNDLKHGPGELIWGKTGKTIKAEWIMDRINGQGTITFPGKEPKECIFKDDIIIQ